MAATGSTLSFDGATVTTVSPSDTTAAVLGAGTPGYCQDKQQTTSSVCTGLSHEYVQTAIRLTNTQLSAGTVTGELAYTVSCKNGQQLVL